MDYLKLATALVGFFVITAILGFLNFGDWSGIIAGVIVILYLILIMSQAQDLTSGFMKVYKGISEETLGWWHMPFFDVLGRNPNKETMQMESGEYWYLTYFDDVKNQQFGAIISGKSEVLSHFVSGMSPKQAVAMFMERKKQNPYGQWYNNPQQKPSVQNDINDVKKDLQGFST